MADESVDLGKFFAENKATAMKAGKNAKATESRKTIPKNTRGKAVLTGIKYIEKDGKMRRYMLTANALTPTTFKGYGVFPTFWMDTHPKIDKTNQQLLEEFIGAMMALAGPELGETIRQAVADGKTGELNKLFAKVIKAKPSFSYSTWGDKNVNFNFDGVSEDDDGDNGESGDDAGDGTSVDDSADAGDDYNADGDGDADAGDAAGDGDGETVDEDPGLGFDVDDVVTFAHTKDGPLKVKVTAIDYDSEKVKLKEPKGQKRGFEITFAQAANKITA